MLAFSSKTGKYFRFELLFLLFLSYIRPVISDLEYSYYEEGNIWNFTQALEFRLVFGTISMILYSVFYWGFLKPLLFKKKTFYLVLSAVGYVVIYSVVNKYQHWLVANMEFLSEDIRKEAWANFLKYKVRFVVNYILSYVILLLFGFAYVIRSLQQDEEVKLLKEQALITELNYLKAQLQPHFFFNTLNNIYALAIRGSKDTAPMVARLSQMMRYIIYESNHAKVKLSQEVEFLSNYMEIEKIRRPSSIAVDLETQGVTPFQEIEPLLLLPLVENAFKHGVEDEMEKGFVRVLIVVQENEVILLVENSKPIKPSNEHAGGVGLENLKKRLALLYADRHELTVENTNAIYRVILSLQLS
ncbi:MAG: sensor histidine kinase [Bacteroidota bacterium]